ncbi:hypothetical protein PG990_000035 [Apiospora arundinis]
MSTPPQNIYIIGAQSTGKSTLRAPCFGTTASLRATSEPPPTRALELQRLILAAQAKAENEATSASQPCWLISDRSAIDPVVYAWQYVGPEAALALMESAEWKLMRDRMAESLVVVCEAGVDWLTDDGVRLMPTGREEWAKTHEVFCRVLDVATVRYVVLPCNLRSTEERLAFVLREFRT